LSHTFFSPVLHTSPSFFFPFPLFPFENINLWGPLTLWPEWEDSNLALEVI
jgi:hypothetical protein